MYRIINLLSERRFLLTATFLLGGHFALMPTPARPQSVPASPVAAEDTLAHFALHPDCRIELVAAEPDVVDPVAVAFAPDGKLWVVEYSDYPNGPPENGPPLSRIRVLTDADGDGRYTDPVTFADKLLFANGLMLWQDGVIVTTDGAVVFMRDIDGDGQADEQQQWFSGFKRENPQLRANHPTLGLDGHIYVASGLRGGEVIATKTDWPALRSASNPSPLPPGERVPEGRVRGTTGQQPPSPQPVSSGAPSRGEGAYDPQPVSLSGRDFRFDPFTGKYESVSGVGQFGLCFDPFGNRFVCSNRNPCKHIVLEDRYLARNPHLAVSQVHEDVSPAAENSRLYPISRTWTTSNLHANQFTAACGVLIYGGDALPQFRSNAFTCEPTANLVHRDVLKPKGATFTSHPGREGVEFLATRDEWFRPVNLTHGPDGALYVVDMYRAVIEHPQFMPTELKTRPDLTLGNDRGRIYRIVNTNRVERDHDSSFRTDPERLVTHLDSPNAWHRDTAFRLLLEHRHPFSPLQLERVLKNHNERHDERLREVTKKSPSAEVRAAAVSLLAAVDVDQDRLRDEWLAIRDRDPRVRRLGVRLAEEHLKDDRDLRDRLSEWLSDPETDESLAFQAALSLGAAEPHRSVTSALANVAIRHAADRWFRAAVGSSSVGVEAPVLMGILTQWKSNLEEDPDAAGDPPLQLVSELARMIGSRGDAEGATKVLALLTQSLESNHVDAVGGWQRTQFGVLAALAEGARRGKLPLNKIMEAPGVDVVAHHARDWIEDGIEPARLRKEALAVAAIDPSERALDVIADTVASEQDQGIVIAAVEGLSRKSGDRVVETLLDGFQARTPSVRSAILNAMLARTDRINRLLDEIEAGNLSTRDIDAATASRLTKSRDAKTRQRATTLLAAGIDVDRAKVVAKYTPCLSQIGDPERGRAIFLKTCATCHKVGGAGTNVGPDISDSRTKTPDFLLTNILDPNRAVDGNYFGYTILDRQGRVQTGIITAETASSVTLRLPEGKNLTLLRRDIDQMANTGLSLMPVGVEKDISVDQMADLISYIKNWRYLDGSVPEEVIGR